MTIAESLAERIVCVRYDVLPEDAVHWARVAILDTVGCTLAGASEPCARIVARVTASNGPCLVFGTDQRMAPLDAALINGTASHALDFDDCSDTLGGHPSAPILPALFALSETRAVDGRAFVAAYVAGWETETRIARGINFHHYEKGWHPTATIGVFGSTAACCHLLGLAPDVTAKALGLAASFASGVKANFGTMSKPLHVGHCSRNGMLAALLAADGLHRQCRSAGAQAGVPPRVQRRREFRRRGDPARLGSAVGHRAAWRRDQAVSLLRQHASSGGCDALAGARA